MCRGKYFQITFVFIFLLGGTIGVFAQEKRPLTLEDCVHLALEKNSQILNAQRRTKIAEANVVAARASWLPAINASFSSGQFRQGPREILADVPVGVNQQTGEVIYEQRPLVQDGSNRDSHSFSLSLSQNIFDFGQTYYSIRQANAARESSRFLFEDTRQNTLYQVYQRYYQLLKSIRLLEVSRSALRSSEEQLKRTQSMYEIGSVAQADVYRAQTTMGNNKINLIQQETAVKNARAALNVIIGRPADAPLEIVDVEEVEVPKIYALDEVLQAAVQNNPKIHQFKADMMAASHGMKAAKARYLPSISGSIRYSRNNTDFSRVYNDFDKNYSVTLGLSMNFNLFRGLADAANVEREAYSYRIAQENLIEQERILRQQAQTALLSLQTWKEISEINKINLKSAEEDLRLAEERYRVGAGTLLDVITAQENVTRARATLVQAKYDTKIAEAQLMSIMGKLK